MTVRPDSQDGSDGAFSGDLDGPSAEATAEDAWLGPDERRRLKEYRLSTARSKEESPRMKRIRALYSLRTEADWLKFIEEGNSDGMAPFTKFAQKYIYEHQHPKNCEGKRLLVMRKFPVDESFGIGAIAQAVGVNLAMALMTGRILVYDTPSPGSRFISDPTSSTCGASWDCIFHKISSCKAPPRVKPPSPKPGDPLAPLIFADDAPVVYLPAEQGTPALYFRTPSSTIPPLLHKLLRKMDPHITEAKMKYWWRAQAAAYVMRPNAVAMERLKTLRTDTSLNRGLIVTEEGSTAVDMPFPLPDGSWSMHVRHGDKGIEMGLVPFLQYASAAERYISENPLSSQKIAFISTEDSEVVELAKKTSRVLSNKLPSAQDGWTWYWSEIQRLNASPEDQLVASGNRTEMTLNWVFQLLTAVEADGFVGTKGVSNSESRWRCDEGRVAESFSLDGIVSSTNCAVSG